MAGDNPTTTQSFSFETVAALVAALTEKGGTLGMRDYELMASLDGTRSASGFDHAFRKVKARAKELIAAKNGGDGTTPTPIKKANARTKSATPASGKKGGKRARKNETADDVDDDESPSKKIKAELDDDEEEKADAAGEGSDDGSA